MTAKHKFRYEIGDLICLPVLFGSQDNGVTTVLVIESPQNGIQTYTVFDFSINRFRYITPGSYVDRHSQRLT